MAGAKSDEDENVWPGFVDALTTMVMVLTMIMMLLGIVVFVLSQGMSKTNLDKIADAAKVPGEGRSKSQTELTQKIIDTITQKPDPLAAPSPAAGPVQEARAFPSDFNDDAASPSPPTAGQTATRGGHAALPLSGEKAAGRPAPVDAGPNAGKTVTAAPSKPGSSGQSSGSAGKDGAAAADVDTVAFAPAGGPAGRTAPNASEQAGLSQGLAGTSPTPSAGSRASGELGRAPDGSTAAAASEVAAAKRADDGRRDAQAAGASVAAAATAGQGAPAPAGATAGQGSSAGAATGRAANGPGQGAAIASGANVGMGQASGAGAGVVANGSAVGTTVAGAPDAGQGATAGAGAGAAATGAEAGATVASGSNGGQGATAAANAAAPAPGSPAAGAGTAGQSSTAGAASASGAPAAGAASAGNVKVAAVGRAQDGASDQGPWIDNAAPSDATPEPRGARVEAAGSVLTINYNDLAVRLDDAAVVEVKEALSKSGLISGSGKIQIRPIVETRSAALSEARKIAYSRAMLLGQQLVAAGIQANRIMYQFEDSPIDSERNLVRVFGL